MDQIIPDLASYDILLANISGGKDSQTMLRELVRQADEQRVSRDRIVCVFADLGDEDEWEGTQDIARHHAEVYGLRFIVATKTSKDGETITLLDHIANRGMWPSRQSRYCTSDLKRDPITKVMTALAAEWREHRGYGGQVRILNVMGLRGEESPARALVPVFEHNKRASGQGTSKYVDNWMPIHHLTTAQVWADIRESGVKHHPIYDEGMLRLSCRFCVLAGKSTLVRAAQLDPRGAAKRAAMEQEMGHTISMAGTPFTEIIAEAQRLTAQGIRAVPVTHIG